MSASPRIPLVLSPLVRIEQERWVADLAIHAVQEIRQGERVLGQIAWSAAVGWEVVGSSQGFEEKAEAVRFLLAGAGVLSPEGVSSRALSPSEIEEFLDREAEYHL